MNSGSPLYGAGGVDDKPPVVFWLYSLLFRVFGLYDMTAVHAFKVLVVLATALFVGLIARRIAGTATAWPAAVLYIAFTGTGYTQMAAANTEVLMMLPATASVWLLLEGRWAASGAVLAVAVLTKQVAVIQLAMYPAAWLLAGAGIRRQLAAAAGFAGGLGLLLAILAATGSVAGFWHWAVVSLVTSYGPSAWTAGQLTSNIRNGLVPWLTATPLLLVPTLVRIFGRPRPGPDEDLVRIWLLLSVAGAVAGGHFFGHYFIQPVGPLAIIAAAAITAWPWWRSRRLLSAVALAALAAPAVYYTIDDYRHAGLVPDPVSAWLQTHSTPSDRVFVWGNEPAVYFYSDRVPASRFPGFLRGFPRSTGLPPRSWDTTPDVWPALAADFAAHPPRYVVDTASAGWSSFDHYPMSRFPVLPEIVATRYRLVTVVAGVDIYALRQG